MKVEENILNKKKNILHFILRYIAITVGAAMYAIALTWFLDPNQLAPGGVSGIAIILKEIFPMLPGLGTLILIFNIPILILGVWKFGVKFTISTIYTVVISSIMMDVMPGLTGIDAITRDPMLAAVIGGALHGISAGVLFRLETTTGGTDVIIKIIRQKIPHLKTGQLYIITDLIILAASALAFRNIEVALYAAVTIYITSMIMDKALYNGDQQTMVYIVSAKREILADRMLKELDLGVTMLQAVGAYENTPTEVIMCVMRKSTLVKVRNLLKEVDPDAFMIVGTANEVFGEGFKDHYETEI